ncbi:MAG: tRNA (cytosine(49)-C(5))-methyltransferase [Candidatus Dojkabacteria bacterium]
MKSKKPRGKRQAELLEQKGKKDEVYTKRDAFISRMASILQVSTKQARSFFSQRSVSVIRLNNLAAHPAKIKAILEDKGVILKEVPWSPYTYIVENRDKSDLGQMESYRKGLFYIQSLSSMLPVVLLDPKPGEKILDMAASPGSKTSQIASLTNNKATIIANDANYERAKNLDSILKMFNVKNYQVSVSDGAKYGKRTPEEFDKVLLDAPCSGEGLIYLQSENPLRFWNIKKVKSMVHTQQELIISAYQALKKGGTLIYSTCTLEPVENEGIVDYLLSKYPQAELVNISIDSVPEFAEYKRYTERGIRKWSRMEFNKFSGRTLRVIPGSVMQGFYIAKIHKPE